MEEIASPQPVFPSGSGVTQDIPILTDKVPESASPDGDSKLPENSDQALTSPLIDHDDEIVPATISNPEASNIEMPDDAKIVPDDTLPVAPILTDEHVTDNSHKPVNLPASASPAEVAAVAEKEAGEVTTTTDNDLPSVAQPPQEAQTIGLPPGVDLQALLNTFASANPALAESYAAQTPATSIPVSQSDTPAASVPVSQAQPSVPDSARPVAPWQVQASLPTSATDTKAVSEPQPTIDDLAYEQFLVDEKRIMGNTAPHEFEPGSRLFVGNLNIETTSKREVFFIFRKYGKLAQVSLKATYGFVQFLTGRECREAMDGEQGIELGGKRLHLEVSKPQPARGVAAANPVPRRRSRSPLRRSPGRSFAPDRRDPYDSYRTISPPARRGSPGRYMPAYGNRRSPSPRRYSEELSLPPRYGAQVPEIQIVVRDESDRTYIFWVESSIRQAGFKVETLFLSPRLGLPTVVRQMVQEGVLAIVQCNRQLQMMNKVSLQVFDRSQGNSNVRFDEYAGLDMATAIGLLRRTQQQAVVPTAAPQQANLAAMIAQMDPNQLQQVIGALSQQQQQQQQQQGQHPSNNSGYPSYPYRR